MQESLVTHETQAVEYARGTGGRAKILTRATVRVNGCRTFFTVPPATMLRGR